ncbi:MAG: IS66 family transposase, partial [bacterium]|nr:IS66 family transposase [bacterium]
LKEALAQRDARTGELVCELAQRDPGIDELVCEVARRDARIAELETELAKARKNSRTSSKPPSSDIVKPPRGGSRNADGTKRKKGGQPGHERHERHAFTADEIDGLRDYILEVCPICGDVVHPKEGDPRTFQQVELEEAAKVRKIVEHRVWPYWCETCQRVHFAALPPEVATAGLVGLRLMVHIAYLKSVCHGSYSTIRTYIRDVAGIAISRGQLAKVIQTVAKAIETPYDELRLALAHEALLNIDETGHKENKARLWTWVFRAANFTVFSVEESRGNRVLYDMLGGEFDGVIGCDYMGAHRKYIRETGGLAQFCLAHLIRDVKYMTTLPSPAARAHGEALLGHLRDLFHIIHRREEMTEKAFQAALKDIRDAFFVQALDHAPNVREARNLRNRMLKHGDAYFTFILTPGIEPTNNLAEQAIRFVVLDRRVTQGMRSEKGRQWSERIWTVIATCAAQGRSVHEFLTQALTA